MSEAVDQIDAVLPSGQRIKVLTEQEAEWLALKADTYKAELGLETASDMSALDRIVNYEMLINRYQRWLLQREDDSGGNIDEAQIRKDVKDLDNALRQQVKLLAIDRTARDRAGGRGSAEEFLDIVLHAARQHDINRCNQVDMLLELGNEFIGLVTRWHQATPEERRRFNITELDLAEWGRDQFMPRFQAVDEYFRVHVVSTWVGQL